MKMNPNLKLDQRLINLPKTEIPKAWYNVLVDLPTPLGPYLSPADRQPLKPEDMLAIFPESLIAQEFGDQRFYAVPDPVREALALWRPTPLVRAFALEKALGVKSRIYYKNESVSPSGSHKSNTAIAQAYFNQQAGITRLTTETGAGQWGTALAMASRRFGLDVRVYMVKVSFEQKPYRKIMMNLMDAEVLASPTNLTKAGRAALAADPDCPGTLGLAISEAVEEAAGRPDTNYALGSVLNHVILHQTVIGQEARRQLDLIGEEPDYLIACHGGGSNFGGLVAPFVPDLLAGSGPKVIAAEPASCPTLTKGKLGYDYGDVAGLTPMMPMYSLGADFQPPAIHAGGLRYHGSSPIVSALLAEKLIKAQAVETDTVFHYARLFAQAEALIPAPESGHAIAAACLKALELERDKTPGSIIFCLSGHGLIDMAAYDAQFGKVTAKAA